MDDAFHILRFGNGRIRRAWGAPEKESEQMFTPTVSRLEVILAMTFLGVLFYGATLLTGSQ